MLFWLIIIVLFLFLFLFFLPLKIRLKIDIVDLSLNFSLNARYHLVFFTVTKDNSKIKFKLFGIDLEIINSIFEYSKHKIRKIFTFFGFNKKSSKTVQKDSVKEKNKKKSEEKKKKLIEDNEIEQSDISFAERMSAFITKAQKDINYIFNLYMEFRKRIFGLFSLKINRIDIETVDAQILGIINIFGFIFPVTHKKINTFFNSEDFKFSGDFVFKVYPHKLPLLAIRFFRLKKKYKM